MLDFHEREQVLQHQRFLAQTPKACQPFVFFNFQRRRDPQQKYLQPLPGRCCRSHAVCTTQSFLRMVGWPLHGVSALREFRSRLNLI